MKDKEGLGRRRPAPFQQEIATLPIVPDSVKMRFNPLLEETEYLAHSDGYRFRHRIADRLAELIEADPLNPDKEYALWRLFRIEASSDLNRLAYPDAMPADRPGLTGGDGLPVKNMDCPDGSPQLHGVDHHQQILAIDLFEKINAAQAKKNQASSSWKWGLFEAGMDRLSRSVIGNEIIADAEDKSGSHANY